MFPFFVVAGASLYCAISFKICSLFLRASNKAVSFSLAIWETKPLVAEFVAVLDLVVVVACCVVVAAAAAAPKISSSFSTIFFSSLVVFTRSSTGGVDDVTALTTSNGASTTSTLVSTFLSFVFINKSTFSSLFFVSISFCFCLNCSSIVSKLFTNENATIEPAIVINGSANTVKIAAVAAVAAAAALTISFLFGTASICLLTNSAFSTACFDISAALSLDCASVDRATTRAFSPSCTIFRAFSVDANCLARKIEFSKVLVALLSSFVLLLLLVFFLLFLRNKTVPSPKPSSSSSFSTSLPSLSKSSYDPSPVSMDSSQN